MEILIKTINEEFEDLQKSQVKGFVRTKKGKLERVNPFSRKGEKKPVTTKDKKKQKSDTKLNTISAENWFAQQKEESKKRQAAGKFNNDDILDLIDKHFDEAEKYAMKGGDWVFGRKSNAEFDKRFTKYIEKIEPRIKGKKNNLYRFYNRYQPQ